jgi:IPT/TIG domain/Putative Ig domain/Glycosyl hydrolase catalytic core
MSSPRLTRCPKKVVLTSFQSGILFPMISALFTAFLAGCVGNAVPSKPTSSPASSALQIATTSLAAGSVGGSYSSTLTATGGIPPYTWGVRGGVLPTGLHLNLATGTITGAPSVAGGYSFTVYVQDSRANSVSGALYLDVNPPPGPSVSGISPNSGLISGGTAVTISGSNFLPGSVVQFGSVPASSVQVVSSNSIRCVTPSEPAGAVSVTVSDSDSQATTVQSAFTFSAPPLQIATASLPAGSVGAGYSTTLTATGGLPPYTWSTAGLPTGVLLGASAGTISGTPAHSGTYPVAVQVKDSKSTSSSANLSLTISPGPAPTIAGVSPSSGSTAGGTVVTISGTNFSSGATVNFGNVAASSVQFVSSTQIRATAPAETAATVSVSVQNSNAQVTTAANAFAFTTPAPAAAATPNADVIVDASQTVSETGRDDLAAVKNIYASASAPEADGGLFPDWNLIASEFVMKRMRNINGLGDCALDNNGNLTGCSRLNNDLLNMSHFGLTPHVVVGQLAPASIGGNPLQWGATQWAQYDALCYAIVNYVANQYGGTGFSEALFEVENEMDTTTDPTQLWLTTTPYVGQGDPSRFTQFDTVYSHWAKAVDAVAKQNPTKSIRIAGPASGFWTIVYGSGKMWQTQIIQEYASQKIRLDMISLHYYGNPGNFAQYAQTIRASLNANGYSNAEIWITEWGASDVGTGVLGAINGTNVGAAFAVNFLLQALKGTVTGGSFLEVRDNAGHDTAGVNADMYEATWNHVENSVEYPKAIANTFSMIGHMTGTRKSAAVNPAKPDLYALASSGATSANLIVSNYNYVSSWANQTASDASKNESVTVAFKNLPFNGPVTVDRYLIDGMTSNLDYWVAAGNVPPSVQATQLQKVESFAATSTNGSVVLPTRQLGQSAVSLWVVSTQ